MATNLINCVMFSFYSSLKHKADILDYEPGVVDVFHSFQSEILTSAGALMMQAVRNSHETCNISHLCRCDLCDVKRSLELAGVNAKDFFFYRMASHKEENSKN